MKRLAMIGTTVFLLLGTSAAYATQDKPEGEKPAKQEGKPEAKPEARPAAKPAAKPEAKPRGQEPQEKPKTEAKQPAKSQPRATQQAKKDDGKSGGGPHGRISEERYSASFGSEHHFHVNQGDYNNHRFNYGGYAFGFIDPWPAGWYYTDDVYVVYDGGGYYMYDVVHPGVRISVNIN